MDYKIIMSSNKNLRVQTPQFTIYQGENKCDNIEVLVPEFYGEIDLSISSVILNWIYHYDTIEKNNTEDKITLSSGNMSLLKLEKSTLREGYLVTKVPLSINFTANTGFIEFWIEVKTEEEILLKTNTVNIKVNDHVNITEFVAEEQIDLLSDMLVQMRQLVNTCNLTLERATEQADRATTAAETTIKLLEEWEAEYGSTE